MLYPRCLRLKRAQKSQVFVLDIQVTRPFIFFIRLPQQHFSFVAPFSAFLFSKAGRSSSGKWGNAQKVAFKSRPKIGRDGRENHGGLLLLFFLSPLNRNGDCVDLLTGNGWNRATRWIPQSAVACWPLSQSSLLSRRYLLLLRLRVPKYATQSHLYLLPTVWPSTLLPFSPHFSQAFFFLFWENKKMKGKNCYFFFPKKEKRKFFLLSVLNQKERRAAETISAAAAGGGGGWWIGFKTVFCFPKKQENLLSRCIE